MIEEINNKPVYTIHEILEGKKLAPTTLYVVGGPPARGAEAGRAARLPGRHPAECRGGQRHRGGPGPDDGGDHVARRHGAGKLTIAEEGSSENSRPLHPEGHSHRPGKAPREGPKLGAPEEDLEIEVVEDQEFNMVRGFYTTGKNIRVKVQVKPGLIAGFKGGARS